MTAPRPEPLHVDPVGTLEAIEAAAREAGAALADEHEGEFRRWTLELVALADDLKRLVEAW
jgi:hypothetical protein